MFRSEWGRGCSGGTGVGGAGTGVAGGGTGAGWGWAAVGGGGGGGTGGGGGMGRGWRGTWVVREDGRMRELLVIGMGPGHPDQITVQAVQALNRTDVFFRIDKGDDKSGLNAAREEILRRHVSRPGYRVVDIPEPPRDRSPELTAAGYRDAVGDWHEARAELIEAAIADELGADGVGAFLVWGDPSLYDSTLRIIDRLAG